MALLTACSASKFVPDGEYMLHKVEIRSQEPGLDPAMLEPYIRQKGNSKCKPISVLLYEKKIRRNHQ